MITLFSLLFYITKLVSVKMPNSMFCFCKITQKTSLALVPN